MAATAAIPSPTVFATCEIIMRKFFLWAGAITLVAILIAAAVLLRTLVFAGQFTQIAPHFSGKCRTIAGVTGGEDLEIDPVTGTVFISAYDRRAVLAGEPVNGALYRLDLSDPDAEPIPLWRGEGDGDFRPHGISLYRSGDGKQRLFVINHPADGRQRVEVFDIVDGWLTHIESISDPLFISPNDLTAAGWRAFYLGNDVMSQNMAMKLVELLVPLAQSTVVYFDGEKASVAAGQLSSVNGTALSRDGQRFFVTEMMGKNLRIYDRNSVTGALTLASTIGLNSFLDNVTVDADDNLWIGAHPRLTDFLRHGTDQAAIAPAQIFRVTPIRNARSRVEEVYLNAGEQISAASGALKYNRQLVLGPVFDSKLLVCDAP